METKITFKFLRELQKNERESSELQKLPADFIEKLKEYISRKRALLENPDMLTFTERKEIENIKPVVKYILDRREQKVVIAAMRSARTGIKPQNMLPHEERLFVKLRDEIKKNRDLLEDIMNLLDGKVILGAHPKEEEKMVIQKTDKEAVEEKEEEKIDADGEKDRVLAKKDEISADEMSGKVTIEMLKDVPAFVGIDLNKYGPWKKGDVLKVPKKIAEALIKTGRAREVE